METDIQIFHFSLSKCKTLSVSSTFENASFIQVTDHLQKEISSKLLEIDLKYKSIGSPGKSERITASSSPPAPHVPSLTCPLMLL